MGLVERRDTVTTGALRGQHITLMLLEQENLFQSKPRHQAEREVSSECLGLCPGREETHYQRDDH